MERHGVTDISESNKRPQTTRIFLGLERRFNICRVFGVNNGSLIPTLFDLIHVREQTLHGPAY